jgi:hypothetical protein
VSAPRPSAARAIVQLPGRYWVAIAAYVVPVLATFVARALLGDNPTTAEIDNLGFGLPAFEDGRWWTLFTGFVLVDDLAIPRPTLILLGVAAYEHVAGHARALAVLLAGHVVAVLLGIALFVPFEDSGNVLARTVTSAIDFGTSNGCYACLGAWTCYLASPWRRRVRWWQSVWLVGPLLFSGHIYDVTHPIGWAFGMWAGVRLMAPDRPDPTPFDRREWPGLLLAIAIGAVCGLYSGYTGGGPGGLFGWTLG